MNQIDTPSTATTNSQMPTIVPVRNPVRFVADTERDFVLRVDAGSAGMVDAVNANGDGAAGGS